MTSLYYYTARNDDGAVVRGSIEAGTASAALSSLRTRSLFVTSLAPASGARGILEAALQLSAPSQKSLVPFFRTFAALISAGVAMRRSLDVSIQECGDPRLREALQCIACDVENGLALSEAMSRRPRDFPRLYVAMIRAGEYGGVLDEVLERIASVMERDRSSRKRVSAALTYPLVVAAAAIALILFLVTSIVPMFQSMYEQMHVPLPAATSALIGIGLALRSPGLWVATAMAIVAAVACILRFRSSERGAIALESLLWALPVAGVILRKATIGRFARMLGTLLRSGAGLINALEVVTDVVSSARYRISITNLRQALRDGAPVSEPLAASGLFEPIFIQMVRVGEETGSLDSMLLRIADYYDVDTETMLTGLGSLLEPAMIIFLGGAVGFIVAAIFIPLYTLIGNIK